MWRLTQKVCSHTILHDLSILNTEDVAIASAWLTASMRLTLRLRSGVIYKDKVNYRSIAVAGDVFVHSHLDRLVRVTYVDFKRDENHTNPVTAYLQRYGSAKSAPILQG